MARKLRTGFELPFSNIGSNTNKTFSVSECNNYFLKDILSGYIGNSVGSQYPSFSGTIVSGTYKVEYTTAARTLSNGSRGCVFYLNDNNSGDNMLDVTQFTSGFYMNAWRTKMDVSASLYKRILCLYDGTNSYSVYITRNGASDEVRISNNTTNTDLATSSLGLQLANGTWYNMSVAVNSTGDITAVVNGTPVTYNTSVSFASWTRLGYGIGYSGMGHLDDISINDGSGASDNSTPNSIRGYNFFDTATLNTNSGFTAVGGTTVLANLQDGSDSTRASASADLSYLDFSLPTLSGTGMAETAANFTKIEAINVYGRQIEATKTSSLLKAKVTDTVAVVNREENLTLPLTVGNDSVTMFDDGSSDWVLANLDSGDMDFRVTFDKP